MALACTPESSGSKVVGRQIERDQGVLLDTTLPDGDSSDATQDSVMADTDVDSGSDTANDTTVDATIDAMADTIADAQDADSALPDAQVIDLEVVDVKVVDMMVALPGDQDGDRVPDEDDQCPEVNGFPSPDGCPQYQHLTFRWDRADARMLERVTETSLRVTCHDHSGDQTDATILTEWFDIEEDTIFGYVAMTEDQLANISHCDIVFRGRCANDEVCVQGPTIQNPDAFGNLSVSEEGEGLNLDENTPVDLVRIEGGEPHWHWTNPAAIDPFFREGPLRFDTYWTRGPGISRETNEVVAEDFPAAVLWLAVQIKCYTFTQDPPLWRLNEEQSDQVGPREVHDGLRGIGRLYWMDPAEVDLCRIHTKGYLDENGPSIWAAVTEEVIYGSVTVRLGRRDFRVEFDPGRPGELPMGDAGDWSQPAWILMF